jgi:eukaryotic-like serine/threonine-protein kinase
MSSNDIAPTPSTGAKGSACPPATARKRGRSFAAIARGTSIGGRYIVLDELGRGGMAIVYRAYDPELDRLLALKLILHRDEEAQASERLLREAQALAQLSHPNVIAVYDVGTVGSSVFMAMELACGPTLRAWLRQTPRSTDEIIDHFLAAGEGLAAAHRARIVHRDFKPSNVLLGTDGRVRVADFGLARSVPGDGGASSDSTPRHAAQGVPRHAAQGVMRPDVGIEPAPVNEEATARLGRGRVSKPSADAGSPSPAPAQADRTGAELTEAGAILGTPEYMSPEQNKGGPVDELSDQYSFCVSLFEAFFGRRPLDGEDAGTAARQSSVRTRVPRRVRAVLTRGLSTTREHRFPSMDALLAELRSTRNRRRSWWPIAFAVAAAATAIVVSYRTMRGRQELLCRGAAAKVTGTWNADRRGAIHRAFLAGGLPYGEHAFTTVSSVLDRYSRDWAAAYTDACEATRLRGEQSEDMLDRRMTCLEQRRMELDATVDVLAHADRTVVENATQAAISLSPVSDCGDLGRLAARVMPPDETTRAEAERGFRELGRAKALHEAGRYSEGEPVARSVVVHSEALRYLPLEADAKLALAQFLDARGAYGDAEHMLRQALRAAQVGGVREVSAAAWIELVRVVGVRLQRHDDAHEWARDAEAQLDAVPGPSSMLGRLLSAESALLYQEGKLDDAARTGERARAILERTLGSEAAPVAEVLKTIGNAKADLGNHDGARRDYERAQSIWEKAFGPSHPAVAAAWNNVGNLLLESGSYDGALGHYRQALQIWEASLGSEHPNIAVARTNIGETLRALGDREGADAAFRLALSIRTRALGADHPLTVGNLANLGNVALDAGDFVEAEGWFEQAAESWERRLGPRDLHLAAAWVGLGESLLGQKRFARALTIFDRALAIETERLGQDHPDLAEPLAGQGQAYFGLRQHERAREKLERALSLVERQSNDPAVLATVRLALAQALWPSGEERSKVRALAVAARDGFSKLGRRGERGLRNATDVIATMQ